MNTISRRKLIAVLAMAPAAVLATRAQAAACYDPASLPAAQRNMRRSLGFVDTAPDARKRCGLCAFFTSASGDCGKCQLLSGGPVPATGHCDSWAAKG